MSHLYRQSCHDHDEVNDGTCVECVTTSLSNIMGLGSHNCVWSRSGPNEGDPYVCKRARMMAIRQVTDELRNRDYLNDNDWEPKVYYNPPMCERNWEMAYGNSQGTEWIAPIPSINEEVVNDGWQGTYRIAVTPPYSLSTHSPEVEKGIFYYFRFHSITTIILVI